MRRVVSPEGHVARASHRPIEATGQAGSPTSASRRASLKDADNEAVTACFRPDVEPGEIVVTLSVPPNDQRSPLWWRTQAALHLDFLLVTIGLERAEGIRTWHHPGLAGARVRPVES